MEEGKSREETLNTELVILIDTPPNGGLGARGERTLAGGKPRRDVSEL